MYLCHFNSKNYYGTINVVSDCCNLDTKFWLKTGVSVFEYRAGINLGLAYHFKTIFIFLF